MAKEYTPIELPNGTLIFDGTDAPEGLIAAPVNSRYYRTNGDSYKKTSGTNSTGWSLETTGGFSGDPATIPFAATIPKAPVSGYYHDQSIGYTTYSNFATTAGTMYAALVVSPVAFRFSEFGISVNGAGSGTDTAYYSIYGADSGGFWPGPLLYQSAAKSTFNAFGYKPETRDQTLSAFAAHWFILHIATNPNVNSIVNSPWLTLGTSPGSTGYRMFQVSRAIGSLMPDPFPYTPTTANLTTSTAIQWRMKAY